MTDSSSKQLLLEKQIRQQDDTSLSRGPVLRRYRSLGSLSEALTHYRRPQHNSVAEPQESTKLTHEKKTEHMHFDGSTSLSRKRLLEKELPQPAQPKIDGGSDGINRQDSLVGASENIVLSSTRHGKALSASMTPHSAPNDKFNQGMMLNKKRKEGYYSHQKLGKKLVETEVEQDTDQFLPDQQYTIPSPEDTGTFFHGVEAFVTMRFMDLSVWLFKTNLLNAMIFFFVIYFIIINLYAAILYGITDGHYTHGTECIERWGNGDPLVKWELAFSLSWTSFSTVGFGTVSPVETDCFGLRYACSFIAFLGVLYAGVCSAVFFAKFSRLLGRAHVIFSSTVVIEYGGRSANEWHDTNASERNSSTTSTSYPVLHFRIINARANGDGNEILDAKLSCLVAIDYLPEAPKKAETLSQRRDIEYKEESVALFQQNHHSLICHSMAHPYFKGIWNVRHVLDENSPLLKPEMKAIVNRFGRWPTDYNTHEAVRHSLVHFHTIIVNLRGTSNLSNSDVFAKKRYFYHDMYVGWQFAGLTYLGKRWRSKKEKLMFDTTLIHDILPQDGGGNEKIRVVGR